MSATKAVAASGSSLSQESISGKGDAGQSAFLVLPLETATSLRSWSAWLILRLVAGLRTGAWELTTGTELSLGLSPPTLGLPAACKDQIYSVRTKRVSVFTGGHTSLGHVFTCAFACVLAPGFAARAAAAALLVSTPGLACDEKTQIRTQRTFRLRCVNFKFLFYTTL